MSKSIIEIMLDKRDDKNYKRGYKKGFDDGKSFVFKLINKDVKQTKSNKI